MDFFLREDIATTNTEYIGYDSVVESVYNYFKEEEYEGNNACAPDISNPKNEAFHDQNEKTRIYCDEIWTKVKSR